MRTIEIYSQPACNPCRLTKLALGRIDLGDDTAIREIDVTEDDEAVIRITDLGYRQTPVVVVKEDGHIDHWSGFRPDKIKKLERAAV